MKTLDVSGFGGGYEQTCQLMLTRGLVWCSEQMTVQDVKYEGYEGVYGVLLPKSEAAKALDSAMLADRIDATGAMHQCVVENLLFILKKGYDAWLAAGHPNDLMDIDDPEREEAVEKLKKFRNEALS